MSFEDNMFTYTKIIEYAKEPEKKCMKYSYFIIVKKDDSSPLVKWSWIDLTEPLDNKTIDKWVKISQKEYPNTRIFISMSQEEEPGKCPICEKYMLHKSMFCTDCSKEDTGWLLARLVEKVKKHG